MPDRDGVEQLKLIREINKDVPVIIVTAYSDWNTAAETCRNGAFAYIRKPFDINKDILDTIKRALKLREAANKLDITRPLSKLGFILGQSIQMKKIIDTVVRIASGSTSCLIVGESGVGKELIARSLHYLSPRNTNQFVALNCAAIPHNLLESELFGYKQGAFTDAHADKKGLVEVANNGTMFLDEISELPIQLQPKLLRLIENSEYMPVGDVKVHKADVRFIAATNVDLTKRIKENCFREDLYYRINVIAIQVPPLRERKDDIPVLAEHFLFKYSNQLRKNVTGFTDRARNLLHNYQWPGNVRELENVIQAAVALTSNEMIDEDDFQLIQSRVEQTGEVVVDKLTEGFKLDSEIERIERDYLATALKKADGNHTQASKLLGMSLSSFRYKAQKYGLI